MSAFSPQKIRWETDRAVLSYAPFLSPLADNKRFMKQVGSRAAAVALSHGGGCWLLVLCAQFPHPASCRAPPSWVPTLGLGRGGAAAQSIRQGWRCLWEPLLALALELQCSPASSQRAAMENERKPKFQGKRNPKFQARLAAVSSQSATGQQGLRDSLCGAMGWGPNPALALSALLSPALALQQVAVREFKGLKLSLF